MKLILILATCGVLATTVWSTPVPRGPQPHGLKAKRSTVSEQEAATAEYADLLSQLLRLVQQTTVQAQIEGLVNSGLSLEDAVAQVAIQRTRRGRSKKRRGKGRKGRKGRRDDDDDDDDDDDSDSSDSDKMVKAQLLKMVGNLVGGLLG